MKQMIAFGNRHFYVFCFVLVQCQSFSWFIFFCICLRILVISLILHSIDDCIHSWKWFTRDWQCIMYRIFAASATVANSIISRRVSPPKSAEIMSVMTMIAMKM